jgi:hypothetical protein
MQDQELQALWEGRMRFQEAEARLDKLAGGRYRTLTFGKNIDGYGNVTTTCNLYVDPGQSAWSSTWEAALLELAVKLGRALAEETPDVDDGEIVNSVSGGE